MNLKDTYNRIAADWVRDHDRDTWWQGGTAHFLSLLSPRARVLDVGCGGGVKSKYIADQGFDVTGIDFSEKMVALARERYPSIGFTVLDMYEVDTLTEKYEGIFMQASLLHIPKVDVVTVLKKMHTRLALGGLLYIAVKKVREGGELEAVRIEDDYGYPYERFFSYFTLDELKAYFRECNLSIVWDGVRGQQETNWVQIIGRRES